MPKGGGRSLKSVIHVQRARAGITSDVQLAGQAHVHYDTLMNWYSDRTVPRPAEVKKIASALRRGQLAQGIPEDKAVTFGDLMAAYEGLDVEPPSLTEAVLTLVDELRRDRVERHEWERGLLEGLRTLTGPPPEEEPLDARAREPHGRHGR